MLALIVVGAVALLVMLWVVGVYNGLVRLRNAVKNAWSQIDVQLKRRHDLIPNLIETAKGYMTHERGTLEAVTQARNLAQSAAGVAKQAQAESGLRAMGMTLEQAFRRIADTLPQIEALKRGAR